MKDPILDEIWRVRKQLIKDHGGLDGFLAHAQEVDLAHRGKKKLTVKKARRPAVKPSRA